MAFKIRERKKPLFLMIAVFAVTGIGALGYGIYFKSSDEKAVVTTEEIDLPIDEGVVTKNGKRVSYARNQPLQAKKQTDVRYVSAEVPVAEKINAAVLFWEQAGQGGVEFEVRTKNKTQWSDWVEADRMDHGKTESALDGTASTLVLAKNIDMFQFRINMEGSKNEPSAAVDLTDSVLLGINSSKGPSGNLSILQKITGYIQPEVGASQISAPKIISRSEWGSPEPNRSSWKPAYYKLKRTIIHHTATTETSNSYADVRAIWHYHARSLKWGDIGYNYLIDSKGRIFQGRYYDKAYAERNRVEVEAGHAYGHNKNTIGVSFIGDYRHKSLNSAAREAGAKIIGYKMAAYNIDPKGASPLGGAAIIGHHQVYNTSCPGTNIIRQFPTIKNLASERYRYYKPLFSFRPLGAPHWMALRHDAPKRHPDSGQAISETFPAGTHYTLVDKIERGGKLYYRTRTDAANKSPQAFLASDFEAIQPSSLENFVYKKLTVSAKKLNPIHEKYDSTTYQKDAAFKIVDQITVGGKLYYRAENDSTNAKMLFFRAADMQNAEYESLTEPLNMRLNNDVSVINPFNGEVLTEETLSKDQEIIVTSKVTTDRTYYRTAAGTENNSSYGIPAENLNEIKFEPVPLELSWMRVKSNTLKYAPLNHSETDIMLSSSERYVNISRQITIGGTTYYQTDADFKSGNEYAIPASALVPINFDLMVVKRKMRFNEPRPDLDFINRFKVKNL